MKILLTIFLIILSLQFLAQNPRPEDFGFRHLQMMYKGDSVDILLKSKAGEEFIRKPLFLFCQGSLPQPLIKTDGNQAYSVFPFNTDSLVKDFHLVIISKPNIPIIADVNSLGTNFVYLDPATGKFPRAYSELNLLDYYVDRDEAVIGFLLKLPFVANTALTVAGHSEGSTIAAKLAMKSKRVTHLIYASGCPVGRMLSIVERDRSMEEDTDSTRFAESDFDYWESIAGNKENMDDSYGDTFKATYDFSYPPINYLRELKIPVLVCYGTKDWSAPFNDYLRFEMIRQKKKNFTFKAYIGLEHNFFPLDKQGRANQEILNWDKVAADWQEWIRKN
ncbi:MAG: dienelactone hydrolase family protein [Bacteroidetes bacterium]|nr:dienelactone hydrolase family protein [Bacteroidota bacterium]